MKSEFGGHFTKCYLLQHFHEAHPFFGLEISMSKHSQVRQLGAACNAFPQMQQEGSIKVSTPHMQGSFFLHSLGLRKEQ
jgi:hypothetical protein